MTYTLWFLIDGDKTPDMVTIPIDSKIAQLKKKIRLECTPHLEKVAAKDLILWKVDVDLCDQAIKERIKTGQYQPPLPPKPLRFTDKISDIWPGPPSENHLQIFVGLPIELSPAVAQTNNAATRDLWPAVTLYTVTKGTFERSDTVQKNEILKLDGNEPDFLTRFKTQLAERRGIESGNEELAGFSSLLRKNHPRFDNYFEPAPIDVEQSDRVSNDLLLCHLLSALKNCAWKEGTIREANVRWIFDSLGMYFDYIFSPRESHGFCRDWPFKIIVKVESEPNKTYRYTPRSDFRISVDGLTYLLVEVQSDKYQYDRYRMLLQVACAARLGRLFYGSQFIVMALYIENSGRVQRYFVFQRDGNDPTVSYVEDSQDWKDPFVLFRAIFENYNLASIIQKDRPEPEFTERRIRSLASDISSEYPDQLESKKTPRDNGEDENQSSKRSRTGQGGSVGLGLRCDEDVYQDRQVVDSFTRAGFTLESKDEDEKGWAPLHQLNPTMRFAKHSNGTPVVVKLLYSGSDELRILRRLNSIKSQTKPIVPLLGTIKLNVGTFIILPEATPLDLEFKFGNFVGISVLDMSRQLTEGIAFLHRHGIAHLDIKPQNIVVLRNRLFIIDFDISVCVDGPDALIDGWCGTPSWMAPEIGRQDGPKRLYSPIRADLWSCGRVLQYLADKGAVEENPFEALTRQLLNKDPRLRPLLHLECSDTVRHSLSKPQAGSKRKADAGPPYAKRLAIST